MKPKSLINVSFKALLFFLGTNIVFLLLMCCIFSFPTNRIRNHVEQSLTTLSQESLNHSFTPGIPGTTIDNYTEALYLNQALVDGRNNGILRCALSGYTYLVQDGNSTVDNLSKVINQKENAELAITHNRFWNGYIVALKPLLFLTDYATIRIINSYFILALFILLFFLMIKKNLESYVLPVIVTFLFMNPFSVAYCMTFVGFFYSTLIPCIIMLLHNDKLLKNNRYIIFFTAIGSCVFFFNMNYFQLISFGIPLVFYYLLNGFPSKVRELFLQFATFFIFWFFGYAGSMLLKWGLYAIFYDRYMFQSMIDWAKERTSSSINSTTISRIDSAILNFKEGFGNICWDIVEGLFILYNIIIRIIKKRTNRFLWHYTSLIFCSLALVIIRYFIFANHVSIHYWVTYRIIAFPILAINIFVVHNETPHNMNVNGAD